MGNTNTKQVRVKVVHKHEMAKGWENSQYIPDVGEIVFYDPDDNCSYTRQKNGDGKTRVHELPFVAMGGTSETIDDTNQTIKANGITFGGNDVVEIVGGDGVTITGDAANKRIIIDAEVTGESVNDTNQTIKANGVTFGGNDVVEIVGGDNVTVTGNAANKKITINAEGTTNPAGENLGLVKTGGDVNITNGIIGVNSVHSSDGNFALNANFNIGGSKAILFAANSTSTEEYSDATSDWHSYYDYEITPAKGRIIKNTCTGTITRNPEVYFGEMQVDLHIPIDQTYTPYYLSQYLPNNKSAEGYGIYDIMCDPSNVDATFKFNGQPCTAMVTRFDSTSMYWTVNTAAGMPNNKTFYINLKKDRNYNTGIYEWAVRCEMEYTDIQGMVLELTLYSLTLKKVEEELVYNVQDYATYDTTSNSIFISKPIRDVVDDLNGEETPAKVGWRLNLSYQIQTGTLLDNNGNLYLNNLDGLATRAIADSEGHNIVNTYATKKELNQASSNTTYTLSKSDDDSTIILTGSDKTTISVSDNDTTYTFATGDNNGQIKVTQKGETTQNISVKGLGSAAYTESTAYLASSTKYAGSSTVGGAATSANKVNKSLTIQLNGGATEGTNKFTFNGSAAKTLNITPSSIGATDTKYTLDCKPNQERTVSFGIKELNGTDGATVKISGGNGIDVSTDESGNIIILGSQYHIATTASAGLMPKLSGKENDFLNGKGAWVTVNNAEEATF